MRQIVLDTETTGLEAVLGHRIVEIGAVEIVNRRLTGKRFHRYFNPEREIEQGALDVHGLTAEFLQDKPRFREVANEFLEFVRGAELIIHNAPFDLGFLRQEFGLLGRSWDETAECSVVDTLALARSRHPGQKNSLDALCKRYGIDSSARTLHGALLDAEILADVYLAMTGGQSRLLLEAEPEAVVAASHAPAARLATDRPPLPVIRASDAELALHALRLDAIDRASGGNCVWTRLGLDAPAGDGASS